MGAHLFVDESKQRGYVLAATRLAEPDVLSARQLVRGLVRSGQRRIHFRKESDPSRRRILAALNGLSIRTTIFDAGVDRSDKAARDACLVGLVLQAGKQDVSRLVLERDDSSLQADQRLLYREIRVNGLVGSLEYYHLRAYEEPLLAVADAVAWCYAKGGRWRDTIRRLVEDVHQV